MTDFDNSNPAPGCQQRGLMAAEAVRVLRGGEWVVVGKRAYRLRDLSDATYRMVKDMGSNNPGFDMPAWFFSGSPFGAQIEALGCEAHEIPDNFRPEYLPRLEKAWAARASIFDRYAAGDDGADLVRAAEAAALERAAVEVNKYDYRHGRPVVAAVRALITPAARTALDAELEDARREGKLEGLREAQAFVLGREAGENAEREACAKIMDKAHAEHMKRKGRAPARYTSTWSVAASAIRKRREGKP